MSQLSKSEILSKPNRLFRLLESGNEVRIVAGNGHVIAVAAAQRKRVKTDRQAAGKPNMKAWAKEVQARLKRRFGDRIVPDSTPMLNESRADRQ